jgi:hypothetical protein
MLNLARPGRLEPLLHGELNHWLGVVSPDGNWIAYESDESGNQVEIFLRPVPASADDGRRSPSTVGAIPSGGRKAVTSCSTLTSMAA